MYAPELYPTTIRAAGMGWVSILDGLGAFFAPYMAFADTQWLSYTIYAVVSFIGRLVVKQRQSYLESLHILVVS